MRWHLAFLTAFASTALGQVENREARQRLHQQFEDARETEEKGETAKAFRAFG